MITEGFINSCFSIILSTTQVRKDQTLYRDVLEIVKFSETRKTVEIPVTVQSKVDCLKKICELKIDGRETDNVIDSVLISGKFDNIGEFIHTKISETPSEKVLSDHLRQVRLRKQLNNLFSNVDDVEQLLTNAKNGNFDSIDDIVLDYERVVKVLYTNLMEEKRIAMVEAASSLDFVKDDFDHVKEQIIKKYERINTTPTGYSVFDNDILNGGFEPSRLYVFGGGSGSGKSTILNNFIDNAATIDKSLLVSPMKKDEVEKKGRDVYIYVTMENTIEESFLRTYQDLFQKTSTDALRDISEGLDIKKECLTLLDKNNSTIIMKYFKSKSISCVDLMMVLDDVILEYGRESIRGLYIDYLDLMKTDLKYDLYRIELGDITLGLKALAVEYNIPVITLTQLSRSVYRTENAHQLNLDQMGESIKKVEHADFVALLVKDQYNDKIVLLKIAKNRSGKSNISAEFQVNFEYFKFISGCRVKNENKSDMVNSKSNRPGEMIGTESTVGITSLTF